MRLSETSPKSELDVLNGTVCAMSDLPSFLIRFIIRHDDYVICQIPHCNW